MAKHIHATTPDGVRRTRGTKINIRKDIAMSSLAIEDYMNITQLVDIAVLTDKGKWWADPDFGSDLWLLEQRGKIDSETLAHAKDAILASLEPLKVAALISAGSCECTALNKQEIAYQLTITRPSGVSLVIDRIYDGV